jgi:hypothetical protein
MLLLPAQGVDGEIVSGPLSPTILTIVILVAIVIVFAVGLVVLVAESYQIVARKTIMAGDEIDTG